MSSKVAMGIAVAIALGNSLLLMACRDLFVSSNSRRTLLMFRFSWGALFSDDQEVIDTVARVIPLVALFQLTDGTRSVLSPAISRLIR